MQMLYGNQNLATRKNREEVTQSSLCLQITVNAQNEKIKIKKNSVIYARQYL